MEASKVAIVPRYSETRIMEKRNFKSDSLTLSYSDAGGEGELIIALHAHWMEAQTFMRLADLLKGEWGVIALDQRGHECSDHARSCTRDDYLGDLGVERTYLHVARSSID